jgi:hypothetical protein
MFAVKVDHLAHNHPVLFKEVQQNMRQRRVAKDVHKLSNSIPFPANHILWKKTKSICVTCEVFTLSSGLTFVPAA